MTPIPQSRSVLTTVLQTLKKRGRDPTPCLKSALDQLAKDFKLDSYRLLFRTTDPG